MSDFLKAKLVSWRKINVCLLTNIPRPNEINYSIYKDNNLYIKDKISRINSLNQLYFFDINLPSDYELGHSYTLLVDSFPLTIIDNSEAVDFIDFDDRYGYLGDDLGAIYQKDGTTFTVWAPLATSLSLELTDLNDVVKTIPMVRNNSVYVLKVPGDLLNYKYRYIVTNNGITLSCNDPYAKGTSKNSLYSVVIDYDSLLNKANIKPQTVINNYVDASIYETHIRDINEGNHNDVINKGKYLGFVETNRHTEENHPAGLDYIKYLGFTHVELQPVLDFASLDDDNKNWYNWGYDNISFFALEGSYSLNPDDAMTRLNEFRFLVDTLHQNNLRLVMDVVYNHIYKYEESPFEILVPHYYFRKTKAGALANASGCGNDFASERVMARKIIIDSVKYLFSHFDIDGLRFDLMGLIDITTIKEAYKAAKNIKEDIMFYGEGWDMGIELPKEERANKNNAHLLKECAFFNDTYRDIIKGPSGKYNLAERGYICGNTDYKFGVDYAFHACVLNLSYQPMFFSANQSLNYLECHDNNTLFDKLLVSNKDEDETTLLDRVSLANAILLLSFGIPFVHMGQEIGLSKEMLDNTYNMVGVNNMNYRLVDERFDMVNRFRFMNILRRKLNYLRLSSANDLKDVFTISHWENGIYALSSKGQNIYANEKEFLLLFNPLKEAIAFELDDYYTVIEGDLKASAIQTKHCFLPGCNLLMLFKK